jgi:1,4-dihydroxy-6-naphthoate synthase
MKSGDDRTLTIGHTPDMDDAFMFYAIAKGHIPLDGLTFRHVIEDIQTLNQRALKTEVDVTAISAAHYPNISKDYWLLSVGSSVGRGYGPLVISKQPDRPERLEGRRVAVPGRTTTASLLLRMALPSCVPVEMDFDQIPQAVQTGQVDAGLVIHEWQLRYRQAGLHSVLDLGRWWQETTTLPLPLGLNVVKRSLGQAMGRRIARLLAQSVRYALTHRDPALGYAMRYARGSDAQQAGKFIAMYVNEDTLTLSASCRKALRLLFERATHAGLLPHAPPLRFINP